MNPQEALRDVEAQRKMLVALAEQITSIEMDVTIYRAVFMALKMANPALFQNGGEYDLDKIFGLAAASPGVQNLMKQRSEELSAQIENAATTKKAILSKLKRPIGFSLPTKRE
jgi:hypothetical protein